VTVHIAHQQIPTPVPLFQHLGVVSVGIHQIIGDNCAIKYLADTIPFGIVFVFDDNGDAKAGGFDANQVVFGIIEVFDGLFCAGLFLEVAVVVVSLSKRKG
jgi:hypothetical protein